MRDKRLLVRLYEKYHKMRRPGLPILEYIAVHSDGEFEAQSVASLYSMVSRAKAEIAAEEKAKVDAVKRKVDEVAVGLVAYLVIVVILNYFSSCCIAVCVLTVLMKGSSFYSCLRQYAAVYMYVCFFPLAVVCGIYLCIYVKFAFFLLQLSVAVCGSEYCGSMRLLMLEYEEVVQILSVGCVLVKQ